LNGRNEIVKMMRFAKKRTVKSRSLLHEEKKFMHSETARKQLVVWSAGGKPEIYTALSRKWRSPV